MKNTILLFLMLISLTGCSPDFEFLYAGAVLDLSECLQHDYPLPRTESFRSTYIVQDIGGNPIANAQIYREISQSNCHEGGRTVAIGSVFTEANGQYTEFDNIVFGNAKDKVRGGAYLIGKPNEYEKSAEVRKYSSQNGSFTYVFIVDLLED